MALSEPFSRRALGWLALLATVFIIYGSLLPFVYRNATLDYAIELFKHLRWIDVGEGGRADLVANLVLYVPFGFFACATFSRRTLLGAAILTALLGAAMAIGIEFTQIWVAPRTVSLNDIITEISGTLIGIAVWAIWGNAIVRGVHTTMTGGREAMQTALGLYLLVYIFIMLFPFDFLASGNEIANRLYEPNALVWVSHDYSSVRSLIALGLKIMAMIPVGAVTKLVWRRGIATAIVVAVYLASAIEVLHLFEVSYRMTISNIAIAALGAALGHRFAESLVAMRGYVTSFPQSGTRWAALAYLIALPIVRGWTFGYAGWAQIERMLDGLNWLPFYYHYFTTETSAVASTIAVGISFLPVGMFRWSIQLSAGTSAAQANPVWPSAVVAAVLCIVLEAGALITANARPDPTNVLIAMAAAMFGQRLCEWTARMAQEVLRPKSRMR